jgi:hypothetical protein
MDSPRRHSEPQQTERPRVKATDLCVGCILWLPTKGDLNGGIKCNCDGCSPSVELDEGGYGHPVLVVRIRQKKGSQTRADLLCDVVCVRSSVSILNVSGSNGQ